MLSHAAIQEDQGALLLRIPELMQPLRRVTEYKHVGTWVSQSLCFHHGLSAVGEDCLLEKAIPTGVAYQSHASLGGLCLSWPNLSLGAQSVLRKVLESFRGEETPISDEKIREEAKVPPVLVLVMARRLQLAARISRGAPPALFDSFSGTDRRGSDKCLWISAVCVTS